MSLSVGAAAGIGAAVSAVSAGGSMISAGIKNRKMWKYRQQEMALQKKYALAQMQAQYDFNKKMWDESNKYNDPSAIFERFRKAGINPAGVLGSSGASLQASFPMNGNVSAPGLGPTTAGDVSAPDFSGVSSSGVQAALSAYSTDSEVDRNRAAARLDRAQAKNIENQTQSPERYADAFDLAIQLSKANVDSEEARAADLQALITWQEAQNKYADLIATQNWLKIVGECALITQQNDRIRALNNAQIPLMEKEAAANITYLLASARNLNASASVQEIEYRDLKEWFDVNWTTPIDVQEVNEKGEPTGNTKKMTGKDIALYLNGLRYTVGEQGVAAEGFMNWQRKHPMLMSVTDKVFGGAAAAAAMRIGAKSRGSVGGVRTSYEEYYDSDGVQKGVKIGRYGNIPLRY